jgi:HAD superfamily hydrolase (TIGR01484 family)
MKPVVSLPKAEAHKLRGLLFDLDDTFLDHTQLSAAAYQSLFALKASGLSLIALTGRPASWAELIVRMWPVDAAIAENGSVAYVLDDRTPVLWDSVSKEQRTGRQEKLQALVAEAQHELPLLVPANDVRGRLSDYTFDIGETRKVDEDVIERAMHLARRRGARTTRSSVHLHFTFDRTDKASGALGFLSHLGYDSTRSREQFAFVGDSDNDASGFAAFATSIGVANLKGLFSITPRYLTQFPKSAGFCQLADHLCGQRSS